MGRLLVLHHFLLLLSVLLLHLLRLLLMTLFHLLLLGIVRLFFRSLLMLLFLLLLELLMILLLLGVHLLLLLLVFLVQLGIAGVRGGELLVRLKIASVRGRIASVRRSTCVATGFRGGVVVCGGCGRLNFATSELSRLSGSSNRGPAVIYRSAQLLVPAGRFHMLRLRSNGRNMASACGFFFLTCGASIDSALATVIADMGFVDIGVGCCRRCGSR